MKISIIIPVYNLEKYIANTIESCLGQTYDDIEVVIVNDGSTDRTEQVVGNYLCDKRVCYVRQDNAGVSAARNHGVKLATGDYITFLDGDDLLEADTIEKNVRLVARWNKPVDWVAFPIVRTDEAGNPIPTPQNQLQDYHYEKEEELDARGVYERYERGLFPPVVCSMFFRQKFFDRQFVEGRYEDTYMFLDLLAKHPTVLLSPYGLYYYVNRESSFINEPFSAEKWWAYTRARIKSIKVGKELFPERSEEFRRAESAMYYNLRWVRYKNRHDGNFSKPLQLLLSEFPNIEKNAMMALRLYAKCIISRLFPSKTRCQ